MKRIISIYVLTALAALTAGGCEPVLIGEQTSDGTVKNRNDDPNAGDDVTTPSEDENSESGDETPLPKNLYVTGVEYPEDVDWQRDIGYDIAGSKLFLMRNGEKIIELSVGYDECVAIDADMHRCIDGHLYTDFSTDDETVVMVDGKEAYRYSGREMIKSICVSGDRIYTLSIPRDGSSGWKYRRDGEEIYSQSEGELVGGLYEDNGDVVFTYKTKNSDVHYMFVNSVLTTINFPSGPTHVFDVRRIGGKINYISAKDNTLTAMEEESLITVFGEFSESYETDMKIYCDGGDRFFVGTTGKVAGVWQEGDVSVQCDSPPVGFYLRGDNYICVLKNATNETGTICLSGETYPWQEGTELMYDTCVATDGFSHTVGLIDKSNDNAPVLWEDGAVTNYNFNGFFTHVDYW